MCGRKDGLCRWMKIVGIGTFEVDLLVIAMSSCSAVRAKKQTRNLQSEEIASFLAMTR